jgi:hypothetical protein
LISLHFLPLIRLAFNSLFVLPPHPAASADEVEEHHLSAFDGTLDSGKGGAKASSGLHGDDADDDDDEEAMHAHMGGGMPGGAQCRQM